MPDQTATDSHAPRPLVEGIFRIAGPDGQTHLIVSRCASCGAYAFPARERCSRCSGQDLEREEAPSEGTLYTWSMDFVPTGLGGRITAVVSAAMFERNAAAQQERVRRVLGAVEQSRSKLDLEHPGD